MLPIIVHYQNNFDCFALLDIVSENHQFKETTPHIEAENGAIYAIPHVNPSRNQNPPIVDSTQLEDLFDGGCYASTYQTNGQCHVYQELPESVKPSPRMRSKSLALSTEGLRAPRPVIPLRFTSSASIAANFPSSTLQNMPGSNAFGPPDTKPPVQVFPYTESRPSLLHFDSKSSQMSLPYTESRPSVSSLHRHRDQPRRVSLPYLKARPSLASLPYLETRPSTATLHEMVEVTPVSHNIMILRT